MVIKNGFELKSAQRVLFDSNTIENVWKNGQLGFAIVLTVRSAQSGDIAVVNDVTITNNLLKNVVAGINTNSRDNQCGVAPYTKCQNAGSQARWNIINNLILFYDPTAAGELQALFEALYVHETYFFRERSQVKALCGNILTELQTLSPRLRVWSAACSSGEEPYSLAMSLLETGRISDVNISIRATDISPRVLEMCERGFYRALSFRATEPAMVQKYFTPSGDGFMVADRVKRLVQFSSLNLMDERKIAAHGPFDAIFCRNVLIYFDKATQKRVVESFARALRPGGYLFLGHAESLFALTTLYEPIVAPESIAYRLRAPVPSVRA